MHDIIKFLKNAVDRSEMAGCNGCYIVKDGQIYSRNMALMAGVEFPSDVNFNVPATLFDTALARMKEIDELNVEEGTVTVRSGRMRSTIKLVPGEPPMTPDFPADSSWSPMPADVIPALELAKEHVGEKGWSSCIRLGLERVTALRSESGIDIPVKGLTMTPCLLTVETAEFLIAQGAPDWFVEMDGPSLAFKWDDGRWMKAQLYASSMPEKIVERIFEEAGTEISVEVTAEFREAYDDAANLTETTVLMTPEGFQGRSNDTNSNSKVEFEITGLPEGHASFWTTKFLGPIMKVATAWNPTNWPAACYFEAGEARGVIMGRGKW